MLPGIEPKTWQKTIITLFLNEKFNFYHSTFPTTLNSMSILTSFIRQIMIFSFEKLSNFAQNLL